MSLSRRIDADAGAEFAWQRSAWGRSQSLHAVANVAVFVVFVVALVLLVRSVVKTARRTGWLRGGSGDGGSSAAAAPARPRGREGSPSRDKQRGKRD